MDTGRLEAFSDGVFAIAITLLGLSFVNAVLTLAVHGLIAVYYVIDQLVASDAIVEKG